MVWSSQTVVHLIEPHSIEWPCCATVQQRTQQASTDANPRSKACCRCMVLCHAVHPLHALMCEGSAMLRLMLTSTAVHWTHSINIFFSLLTPSHHVTLEGMHRSTSLTHVVDWCSATRLHARCMHGTSVAWTRADMRHLQTPPTRKPRSGSPTRNARTRRHVSLDEATAECAADCARDGSVHKCRSSRGRHATPSTVWTTD
jgi:hypothetical protein